jgi:hypothetical protein
MFNKGDTVVMIRGFNSLSARYIGKIGKVIHIGGTLIHIEFPDGQILSPNFKKVRHLPINNQLALVFLRRNNNDTSSI